MSELMHVCTHRNCEARFSKPSKLEIHLRKHSGERPFVCNEENCNKSYTNESHLRRHKSQKHQKEIEKSIFKCTIKDCNSEFVNSDNLKRHKRTVHATFYGCEICQEKFHKKHKLRSHMLEHSGGLKCQLCSAEFKHISEYTKHKNRHKTYTCSCGKDFYRWTVYLKHRKTEHIKHICNVCKKQFAQKQHLKEHLQTHQETRTALECPMENCERLYFYKRNLKIHLETYHFKIKKPLPPSKQLRKIKSANREKKHPKTLETGRKPRKDKGEMKKSSALKLVGLTVPYEGEKTVVQGNEIVVEISDLETDHSDLEPSWKMMRKENNTSDSDSSSARMIPVC